MRNLFQDRLKWNKHAYDSVSQFIKKYILEIEDAEELNKTDFPNEEYRPEKLKRRLEKDPAFSVKYP